jgi:deleted-in-malignant-brain-tumors protein 1
MEYDRSEKEVFYLWLMPVVVNYYLIANELHASSTNFGMNEIQYCLYLGKRNLNVRLTGVPNIAAGRVEVYHKERWNSVCIALIQLDISNFVCYILGYEVAYVVQYTPLLESGKRTVQVDSVTCYTLGGAHRSQCIPVVREQYNCTSGTQPEVYCDLDVRVANPVSTNTTLSGRLEVFFDGEWGTVCNHEWDMEDATVACRQLGYSHADSAYPSICYGDSSKKIWMSEMRCRGNEVGLQHCAFSGWGKHHCSHIYDAGVSCVRSNGEVRLIGGVYPTEGKVEIYDEGRWNIVCGDNWSFNEAVAVCNQLGYVRKAINSTDFISRQSQGLNTSSFVVSCTGKESEIKECRRKYQDCKDNIQAKVACIAQIRLVGGGKANEGRLERNYLGEWLTVCSYSWDLLDANVVCLQLRYGKAKAVEGNTYYGVGSKTMRMENVQCHGNESSFEDCKYNGWETNDCFEADYVKISCEMYEGVVKLVGGSNSEEGRVEIYHGGVWRSVCGKNWNYSEALVVCKQLRYHDAIQYTTEVVSRHEYHKLMIDNVSCTGNETTLNDCSFVEGDSQNCTDQNQAKVVCVAKCIKLNHPTNGKVTEKGATATYTCNKGFRYRGSLTRKCMQNQKWSGNKGHCVAVDCGRLSRPRNGSISLAKTTFRSLVHFSCDDSLILKGSVSRMCQSNGKWSGTEAHCLGIDCLNFTEADNCKNRSFLGLIARHSFTNNLNLTRLPIGLCHGAGWQGNHTACLEIKCGLLKLKITMNYERMNNKNLSFSCVNGHQLVSEEETNKQWNADDEEWCMAIPRCIDPGCVDRNSSKMLIVVLTVVLLLLFLTIIYIKVQNISIRKATGSVIKFIFVANIMLSVCLAVAIVAGDAAFSCRVRYVDFLINACNGLYFSIFLGYLASKTVTRPQVFKFTAKAVIPTILMVGQVFISALAHFTNIHEKGERVATDICYEERKSTLVVSSYVYGLALLLMCLLLTLRLTQMVYEASRKIKTACFVFLPLMVVVIYVTFLFFLLWPTNHDCRLHADSLALLALFPVITSLLGLIVNLMKPMYQKILTWCLQSAQGLTSVQQIPLQNVYSSPYPDFPEISSVAKDFRLEKDVLLEVEKVVLDFNSLQLKQRIGQGHFGAVYKAVFKQRSYVAVKAIIDTSDSRNVHEFIREALQMRGFDHPNVMHLIGICWALGEVTDSLRAAPLIVLPFMQLGDLKRFLRNCKIQEEEEQREPLELHQLVKFCLQIAKGMEYLVSRGVIHRDLAARNCMLHGNMNVKVSDFGLSRVITAGSDYYRCEKGRPLPVKWMAPESLTVGLFTTFTDVWSFGVTVWEVMTFGEIPYSGISNSEILTFVEAGNRLKAPKGCPEEIYDIMDSCWREDAKFRPTFTAIVQNIEPFLQTIAGYMECHECDGNTEESELECGENIDPADFDVSSQYFGEVNRHDEKHMKAIAEGSPISKLPAYSKANADEDDDPTKIE